MTTCLLIVAVGLILQGLGAMAALRLVSGRRGLPLRASGMPTLPAPAVTELLLDGMRVPSHPANIPVEFVSGDWATVS